MKQNSRILIVDDCPLTTERLTSFLENKFEDVITAHSAQEGWNLYNHYNPDIVLTEIQLSKTSGLELIRNIRHKDSECFIAIITSRSERDDLMRVISMRLDGYFTKPLSSVKLALLVQKIRHHKNRMHRQTIFLSDDCTYDPMSKKVYWDQRSVSLVHKEIVALELLIEHRGEIVTYTMFEYAFYDTRETTTNAIKIIISRLRKKLPPLVIETIPKTGYSLQ